MILYLLLCFIFIGLSQRIRAEEGTPTLTPPDVIIRTEDRFTIEKEPIPFKVPPPKALEKETKKEEIILSKELVRIIEEEIEERKKKEELTEVTLNLASYKSFGYDFLYATSKKYHDFILDSRVELKRTRCDGFENGSKNVFFYKDLDKIATEWYFSYPTFRVGVDGEYVSKEGRILQGSRTSGSYLYLIFPYRGRLAEASTFILQPYYSFINIKAEKSQENLRIKNIGTKLALRFPIGKLQPLGIESELDFKKFTPKEIRKDEHYKLYFSAEALKLPFFEEPTEVKLDSAVGWQGYRSKAVNYDDIFFKLFLSLFYRKELALRIFLDLLRNIEDINWYDLYIKEDYLSSDNLGELKPQSIRALKLGIEYSPSFKLSMEGEFSYKNIDRYHYWFYEKGTFILKNTEKSVIERGVSGKIRFHFTPTLSQYWQLEYKHYNVKLPEAPSFLLSCSPLNYKKDKFSFYTEVKYCSKRYQEYERDEALESYFLVNSYLTWKLFKPIEVKVEGENIFGKAYKIRQNYPGPKNNYSLTFIIKL